MTVKSKQSLGSWLTQWKFNYFSKSCQPDKKKQFAKHPVAAVDTPINYQELTFRLATTTDIHEEIPNALCVMQENLNIQNGLEDPIDLYVVISNVQSGETFVHYGREIKPPPHIVQFLHRAFTINRTPPVECTTPLPGTASHSFLPRKLLDQDNIQAWLLTVFKQGQHHCESLNEPESEIAQTLSKGIAAWRQQDRKIKQAVAADRALYAAELHDSLAQVLGYLRIKSARLDSQCASTEFTAIKSSTEDIAAYTHCAYRQCRELIASARASYETEYLSDGILDAIAEFEQQSAIVFELDNRVPNHCLSRQQAMQVLYIIREALSNTIRHSHATHSRIILTLLTNKELQITVEDNGVGLTARTPRRDSFGLQIMRERANRIRGQLDIGDRPGGGTRLVLKLAVGNQ